MNYLGLLEGKQWVAISEDFDYVRATRDFIGLKLFPMVRTENMKLAVAELVEGSDVPVMALVHALDTEARIGDRPDFQEIEYELLLVKEKLNQGEALRKKLKDLGMSNEEKTIMNAVFNDAANLISRVITRFEVAACEALATAKMTVNENNAKVTVDYKLPEDHKLVVSGWSNASHDILADLVAIRKNSKNKIVRAFTSDKVMGYILGNAKLGEIAAKQGVYVTEDFAKRYIMDFFGIEFITIEETYKLSAQDGKDKELRAFPEDTISFVTTKETLGNTYVTSSPEEDYGIAQRTTGFVSVTQWYSEDPAGVWTKASAIGLPVFRNIKQLYVCKVKA